MTKHKMIQPEVIPGFDVLKWKAETQARIYQDIKDMTSEEQIAYFRRGAERFDEEQRHRREERQKAESKK